MKIIVENLKTVASELEEKFQPSYEIHCRIGGEDALCGRYNSYDEAYGQALRLAQTIAEDEFESAVSRKDKINSIYIYEDTEGRDVTTAELKNEFLKIIENEC